MYRTFTQVKALQMSELSIKVKIAGRQFPLTIQREEEEAVRLAAKRVDEQFRFFQDNYAVKDRSDLLAMTALQMATLAMKAQPEEENESKWQPELEAIRDTLKDALS